MNRFNLLILKTFRIFATNINEIMMKSRKASARSILIIFVFITLAFIGSEKYFLSLISAVLGFYIYRKAKKYGEGQKGETEINVSSVNSLPDFHIRDIQGKGLQFLESIYIVMNTKNLDTLRGRIEFIDVIYPGLVSYSSLKRYAMDAQSSIDRYKAMYYDKVLTSEQAVLLLNPDNEKLKQLYSDCVFACYERYVKQQSEELARLKTHATKERRREDIIKKGYDAKHMFKMYELPDNGHLQHIEDIRKGYYSYQKEIS